MKTSAAMHIWQFSSMSNIQRDGSQVHVLSAETLSRVTKSTRIGQENTPEVTTKFIGHLDS